MEWAYGVTTCPERMRSTLTESLRSLAGAGFERPHIFIDGCGEEWPYETVTRRCPPVLTAGNWVLSAYELLYRSPGADWFAIFQDDVLYCRNLRPYLEKTLDSRVQRYYNLYTWISSQSLAPRIGTGQKVGWFEARCMAGPMHPGGLAQQGRGALALVFARHALVTLLGSAHLAQRPLGARPHKAIDGGIVEAMNRAGYREYVHHPSLAQHMEGPSSIGNPRRVRAISFPGEGYDAMQLTALEAM